jgi:esterase
MDFARHSFNHDGLTFSFLDTGTSNQSITRPAVIALHAHLMQASSFAPVASHLSPRHRVIALDQRGHGESSHARTYTREDYLGDIAALMAFLDLPQAVLLGNSLGGANAYQFAARHPKCVAGLVVEEIGAVVTDDISFVLPWGGNYPNREELEAAIGPRFLPYMRDSFRQSTSGWHLAFEPAEMVQSQRNLVGDHWSDWLASICPALLIRGSESRVTSQEHMEEMAARRPNTALVTLAGGHVVHADNPRDFNQALDRFFQELPSAG